MSPRVTMVFEGKPQGALGAARQVGASVDTLKTKTSALARENAVAAGSEAKLSAGMKVSSAEARRAAATYAQTEREVSKLGRGALAGSGIFRGLGRSVAFASTGFLGAYGLTAAISGAFGELENGIKVGAQTQATLKSTGAIAGITAKGIDQLATSQERLSGIDDE